MEPRIDHPAQTIPGAMQALQKLEQATQRAAVPAVTHELLKLRAGQINGCSGCVDIHSRMLKALGEPDERIFLVGAWRDSSYYTDAERAALALTEAARHYDEDQLASLVLSIALINTWNRLNVATHQVTGEWVEDLVAAHAAG